MKKNKSLIKSFIEIRKRRKESENLEDKFWEESLWNEDAFFNQLDHECEIEEEKIEVDYEPQKKYGEWDWEKLTDERNFLKNSDPYQREKYIRSLVKQLKDADAELDKLSYEYNVVTATLKDMDEIEALPEEEKAKVKDYAQKLLYLERETTQYEKNKSRMTESQFYKMEQFEDSASHIYEEMKKAEIYREKIGDDLSRLDNEKTAYAYRASELQAMIANCKGMVMVSLIAMVVLYIMLVIMQFGFSMNVMVGYLLTTLAGAIFISILYMKYLDGRKELNHLEKAKNRIILLQNTVKIRYVNNFNLLDYLYLKYQVKDSKEWKKLCDLYKDEKVAREQNQQNEEEMDYYQLELLKILRCYQLSDARLWLHRPLALYDHKEMVEIRHEHIVRRQKLRAQMDYNKRLGKEAKNGLKYFADENPSYSAEILKMMERYS